MYIFIPKFTVNFSSLTENVQNLLVWLLDGTGFNIISVLTLVKGYCHIADCPLFHLKGPSQPSKLVLGHDVLPETALRQTPFLNRKLFL